jgi:hypothetical protein
MILSESSIQRLAERLGPTTKQKAAITLMGLASYIQSIINEQGPSSMLRGRLELARDQARVLEDKVARLEVESGNRHYSRANSSVPDSFVEHRGALFKRGEAGGYEKRPFCPGCLRPMTSLRRILPYSCSRCQYSVEFAAIDLQGIMMAL